MILKFKRSLIILLIMFTSSMYGLDLNNVINGLAQNIRSEQNMTSSSEQNENITSSKEKSDCPSRLLKRGDVKDINEAKPWCDIEDKIYSYEDFIKLRNASISPEEIFKLKSFGNYQDADNLILWKKNGFSVSEFGFWQETIYGTTTTLEDIILLRQSYSVDEIKEWRSLDVYNNSSIEKLKDYGINSINDARKWKEIGITNIRTLERWFEIGINTPEKLKTWLNIEPNLINNNETFNKVEKAIKNGYTTPESYKSKVTIENKEKEDAKKVCKSWEEKAHQMTFSLGIGDQIVSINGGVYTILNVYQNTFLVNIYGQNIYLQKSESIPYNEIKNSPNKYCLEK